MAELGGDVDDAAASRAPQLRHRIFAHHKGAGEIDRDGPVPLVERKRLDRAIGRDGGGDIDQRGEPPKFRNGSLDRGLRARLVGDVNLERLRTAAAGGDGARRRFRFGRIEIGNRDLGSLRGKASADRAADLATAAGDQCHPMRQPVPYRHQLAAC